MKKAFYSELAYIIGMILLALGTGLMTVADFGVSMVVAPAYLLHLKISEFLPFFSFGMAEYTLQAVLLILMMLVIRKFKVAYLFSFVTAVIYGILLDCFLLLISLIPPILWIRILMYSVGLLVVACGIALLFRTYISPEAYELFVMEVSKKFKLDINKFKIGYDMVSLAVSVLLSFLFFGLGVFRGISWGTIISAFLNGIVIKFLGTLLDKRFEFKDKLTWRKIFEK